MLRVSEFFKVSLKQFMKSVYDVKPSCSDSEILNMFNYVLKLPERATKGSAGYDFVAPFDITLSPGQTAKIPTGIRVKMEPGWVLMIFPRSGLGFKYRLQLNNTVGIIDEDYFYSDNEGHIFIKLTNDSNEGKCCRSRQEKHSHRVFSFRSVLLWMMSAMGLETADSEVHQNNCRKILMTII